MDNKLAFLLLVSVLIVPAQLGKHGHGHEHGHGHGHGHGHEHGHGRKHEPKRKWFIFQERIDQSAEQDYDYEATDPPSEEDEESDWLFRLQDVSDVCDPNPCQNDGVCEEKKKGRFKCDCPKPFKGKRCQKSRACRRNTCHHGQCVLTSTPPYYECKCKDPYQPPNCKHVAVCNPGPCQNGGSCIPDGHKFECACPDTFSGKFCQVGPGDCREGDGESYRGQVSETEDGDDCLFWNSRFIVDKGTDPFSMYEDDTGLGPHNHCRNPDGDLQPWCFIRRRNKLRWEYCNVTVCPGPPVTTPAPGVAVTASGSRESTTAGPVEKVTTPVPKETGPASGSGEVTPAGPAEEVTRPPPTEEPAKPIEGPTEANVTEAGEFASCGRPQLTKLARVYGGMKAIPGAHPWQVSVQVRPIGSAWTYQHTCGGVLIKPCWALTAGHCIDRNNTMRVVLGGVTLGKQEPFDQTVEVEEAIRHEDYREAPWAVYNDIALLKLKGPKGHCVKETKFVKTACLPNATLPDGTQCSISGWGSTETSNFGSNQLLDAKVLLIPQHRCKSLEVYGDALDDTMFCAGYLQGGVDSCQGDSGGPLVCEMDGVHYVYGLVSWGDSCAKKNKPGVYTRLTRYVDWINAHVNQA